MAATAADCDCGGGGGTGIQEIGEQADAAAPKVGALQQKLLDLANEFTPDKVIATASAYDQLKLSLKTLLGSTEGAANAFQMILDFAGRTPFTVESTTEAFNQLWKAGIQPTTKNLTAFGNVAAAFGKDLTAVTSAISGVDLGDLGGLRDLGFRVEEQGNKLKITFGDMTATVGNSSQAVARYSSSSAIPVSPTAWSGRRTPSPPATTM